MTILKNRGITYANYALDMLSNYYADEERLYIHVETFYNCREQGYVLSFRHNEDFGKQLNIWVYGQRNSDKPTISWGEDINHDNMFTEETYRNRTTIYDNVEKAVEGVVRRVSLYFDVK